VSLQIAQRYTQALFDMCEASKDCASIQEDLRAIAQLIEDNEEFAAFLSNPIIPKEKQAQIIDEGLSGKISTTTLKYLHFLIDKARLDLLKDICDVFDGLYLASQHVARVKIFASSALDERQNASLKKHLKEKLNQEVDTDVVVDPRMIGGMKIRIGDEIHDYSLSAQLEAFRQNLLRT